MVISIDAEKAFDKTQSPFIVKTLNQVGMEGNYLNMIKAVKPTADTMFNGERLKAFCLGSGCFDK